MPSVPAVPSPSKSGIVTTPTGERKIPSSVRPDGSTRKPIKIRPGYRPIEDVEVYKNRPAETWRNRGAGGVPGADGLKDEPTSTSAAGNKNAKRREARKKAKASDCHGAAEEVAANALDEKGGKAEQILDVEAEREKKTRNLRKKLKQAKELKEKKEGGTELLPEQFAKVIKINELVRELAALGCTPEVTEASPAVGDAGTVAGRIERAS